MVSRLSGTVMFKDRKDAGKRLGIAVAEALTKFPSDRPIRTIVVGLVRGGIIVGKEVSSILCAPLTLIATKKINAPDEPEVQLAAVSSRGVCVLSDTFDDSVEGLPSYVRNQQLHLVRLTKTMEQHWLEQANYQPPALAGKRIVVVSDGPSSGLTELAALRSFRQDKPFQLIFATPVISEQCKYRLEAECDMVIALLAIDSGKPAMQFYEQFGHVDDASIINAIKTANQHGSSV